MILVNGRGQLGKALEPYEDGEPPYVYHTWNTDDKSHKTQLLEYIKYRKFVTSHDGEKIVFISTSKTDFDYYLQCKMMAELLTFDQPNGCVVRIPTLIGKGICDKIKNGYTPFQGTVEIDSPESVAEKIIDLRFDDKKLISIPGHIVDVSILKELILF